MSPMAMVRDLRMRLSSCVGGHSPTLQDEMLARQRGYDANALFNLDTSRVSAREYFLLPTRRKGDGAPAAPTKNQG